MELTAPHERPQSHPLLIEPLVGLLALLHALKAASSVLDIAVHAPGPPFDLAVVMDEAEDVLEGITKDDANLMGVVG